MCSASCETGRPLTRAEGSAASPNPRTAPREGGGGWWRLVEVVEERRLRPRTAGGAAAGIRRAPRARGAAGGGPRPPPPPPPIKGLAGGRAPGPPNRANETPPD